MQWMIYGTMLTLALGLVTSTSLLALSHLLIFIPCLYFIPKTNWRSLPPSFWALLGVSLAMILSVLVNWEIIEEGWRPILKVKYFVFSLLMIAPLSWYFKNCFNEKKIRILIYTICVASIVAGLAGTTARYTEFNPILRKHVNPDRNSGLSGMVLNYAHNLAYLQIILLGFLFATKEKWTEIVNRKFILIVFMMNIYFLYTTFTRGAIIAFLAGIPFYFVRKKKHFSLICLGVLLSGLIAYSFSGKSLSRPVSDMERMSHWKTAIKAVEERPLFGFGYLNFEIHSLDIKNRHGIWPKMHGHAHNNFLEMLASTGIVGFIFYVAWIILWFIEMYKRNDLIAQIGAAFVVTSTVSGLTDSTIGLGFHLFFIMAGYSFSQIRAEVIK